MFHQGFADALAKVFVAERTGALDRRPPRFRPRDSRSDASLSLFGAATLLVLVLTGPAGAALVGLVGLAVIWPLRDLIDRRPRGDGRFEAPAPEVPDRWRVWRVHEPDAAYLRRGRAA
jgi:hypothetical protein